MKTSLFFNASEIEGENREDRYHYNYYKDNGWIFWGE